MTLPTADRHAVPPHALAREVEHLTSVAAQGAVRPVSIGLAVLYAGFDVAHALLQPPELARILAPVALLSAGTLALLAVTASSPDRVRGHRALGLIAGVALGNSLLHLWITRDPMQTTNLYLVVVGCGILLFRTRDLGVVIAASVAGWAVVAAFDGFRDPRWAHFGVGMASAVALSVVVHWARNRFIARVASLEVASRARERLLGASEARYRHLFDASPAMICVHDPDGVVTDVNAAGAEALGGTRADIVGQPIERFLVNGGRGAHHDYLEGIRRLGRAAGLALVRTLDGRERSWLYDNTLFRDPEAGTYVLGTALDVTELQRAREQLEAAASELELQVAARTAELRAANARLAEELQDRARMESRLMERHRLEGVVRLAGGVAHEFNNILGIIRGNAELARVDAARGAAVADYLDAIEDATVRGADLVEKVQAFSRPDTSDHAPFEVAPVLREVASDLAVTLPSGVALDLELREPLGRVVGSPPQIREVLVALVENARLAMPPQGGRITVRAIRRRHADAEGRVPGDVVRVEVIDNGRGIPARNLARVFDPFFTTREVGQGYGLGLSVAHGIVRAHGGDIRAESPGSGGTRVSFTLPVAPAAAATRTPAPPDEYVLVVDDEPAIVRIAQRCLERRGYRVATAGDVDGALAALRRTPGTPILLLTDLSMPDRSGEELVRQARLDHPGLRILVMSGYGPTLDVDRLGGPAVASILNKPFRAADLDAAVEAIFPAARIA